MTPIRPNPLYCLACHQFIFFCIFPHHIIKSLSLALLCLSGYLPLRFIVFPSHSAQENTDADKSASLRGTSPSSDATLTRTRSPQSRHTTAHLNNRYQCILPLPCSLCFSSDCRSMCFMFVVLERWVEEVCLGGIKKIAMLFLIICY